VLMQASQLNVRVFLFLLASLSTKDRETKVCQSDFTSFGLVKKLSDGLVGKLE